MKSANVALAMVVLSCLLVACGGGGTSASDTDVFSQPHPVATDAGPLADMAVPTPRQAAAVRTPDATSFFSWAESNYPNFFPSGQMNMGLGVWTYRHYPQTDIYLGIHPNGDVLGLLGKGGGAYDYIQLEKLTNFGCSVYPSDCVVVSTVAGGTSGFVDGNSIEAKFKHPNGVAVDSSGNVFVADSGNNAMRKITTNGVVSTIAISAGLDVPFWSDQFPTFGSPADVAVDNGGNVYVVGSFSRGIYKITPTGAVSRIVDITSTALFGVAVDSAGNLFVAADDAYNQAILKSTPSGMVRTFAGKAYDWDTRPTLPVKGYYGFVNGTGTAARFNKPTQVAVDSSGNVFVADCNNNAIRKITSAGVVSTIAGGTVGFMDGNGTAAKFNHPNGVAVDSRGNVFVSDSYNNAIRKISPMGAVSTLAGSRTEGFANGFGAMASFNSPLGVAVDSSGNVYVADAGNNAIRKITPQ